MFAVTRQIHDVSVAFGQAVCAGVPEEVNRQAQAALNLAYRTGELLAHTYIAQLFQLRHQRQPRLDTALACPLSRALLTDSSANLGSALVRACNQVVLPVSWHVVEAKETIYNWDEADALLNWALEQGLEVTAGPLVDFSSSQLPGWPSG